MTTDREILARISRQPNHAAGYKQLVRELGLRGGEDRRQLEERLQKLKEDLAKANGSKDAPSLEKQIQALEKAKADTILRFQGNARQIVFGDILWGLFNSTEFTFNH